MSLILTESDQRLLRHALTTISAPLDFPTIEAWGAAVVRACQPLFAFDQALFGHALTGQVLAQSEGARTEEAARSYMSYFWQVDRGMNERRRALGLEVYHRDMVYDRRELPRTEIYVDWCVPHRLHDKIGMCAEDQGPPMPAMLHFFRDREGTPGFSDRGLALLELMLPAFKAGVAIAWRLARDRRALLELFEHSADAVSVVGTHGVLHQNRRLLALLAADPARERIEQGIGHAASSALALLGHAASAHKSAAERALVTTHDLRTPKARYRIRTSVLATLLGGARPAALVTVEQLTPQDLPDTALATRYALTSRECQVARLLAGRHTSAEIARALDVSVHTARRHVESVLRKLGVHSRTAVAAKIRE